MTEAAGSSLSVCSQVIWPLINPDMFTSIVDMVEDTLQASLPG
jgi:Ca2+-dependent lipid-binding protein